MQFTLSCNSCICEVSFCIVSWLSLNFAQRIRQLSILEISSILPFREYFKSESRSALSR